MKTRKFVVPVKPATPREIDSRPRERRRLGLNFGGGDASGDAAAGR